MAMEISPYHVRRAVWIDATSEEVWAELTTFERMRAWYGTGHTLAAYEPRLGGVVETVIGAEGSEHRFRGEIVGFEPGVELSFEQLWLGSEWLGPATVTIRLTPHDGGTLVELFHHGFERVADDPGDLLRGFEDGWSTRQLEALHGRIE